MQTVNYFSKKSGCNLKKHSSQRPHQQHETKKVVFSDEVLNLPGDTRPAPDLHHGSDSKLNVSVNFWENAGCLSRGTLPFRHVSSPDINSFAEDGMGFTCVSELVLNSVSEQSILSEKNGPLWSDTKHRPILRTKHSPTLPGNTLHCRRGVCNFPEEGKPKKRKRCHGEKVESKARISVRKLHFSEMTETDPVNVEKVIGRDSILRPASLNKEEK